MSKHLYVLINFSCSVTDSPKEGHTFKIDFQTLFNTLCKIVTIDQATLLLYLLLHRNPRFYRYAMEQENLQQMVIPILQTLYNAPDSTSHHIYMTLIVLLILSEDDGFNKSVHQIVSYIQFKFTWYFVAYLLLLLQTLKNIHWYTERSISEISLGGLLVLVVIRTIQYNMLKMRDKYLHTNCLAALANMSGQFRNLHPYVAQRLGVYVFLCKHFFFVLLNFCMNIFLLVSLFETLAKKHARLETDMKELTNGSAVGISVDVSTNTNANNADSTVLNASGASNSSTMVITDTTARSIVLEDLSVLEEVLRMVLEILNSCISHQLVYCPNLVYTLLYKRQVFESFRSHSAFQDILQNIDMVKFKFL